MKIAYDAKRYFHNRTGLGNYSRTLVAAVKSRYADIEPVLYDEQPMMRTFSLGRKAALDGCQLFHGLSNELPRDVVKAGIPSIVTIHDVAWRTFPKMYSPIDRIIYDWKYGHSARIATRVIAISESTKRDVMRYYGVSADRIEVIYQPVQQDFYTRLSREEAFSMLPERLKSIYCDEARVLLTVGSINSRKNLLGMLKAFHALPDTEKIPFVVIGNGREYRRECEKYIAANNLEPWVYIFDDIHDVNILHALYTLSAIMLYPSFYEGFGLPVVEAALQQCPVITSNVSSLPEAAGNGALYVDPYNVEEMRDAMLQLLRDADKCRYLGVFGRQYAMSHFHPDVLTRQLYQLYAGLKIKD